MRKASMRKYKIGMTPNFARDVQDNPNNPSRALCEDCVKAIYDEKDGGCPGPNNGNCENGYVPLVGNVSTHLIPERTHDITEKVRGD